jgi:hypothetical protein
MIRSNINIVFLDKIFSLSSEIEKWISDKNNPEKYNNIADKQLVCDFVHTLDLLETILTHFKLNACLSKLALKEFEKKIERGTIGWEFWQIDIEHFFAANILELCYQLSNAWKEIEIFETKDKKFKIFKYKYKSPSDIILARHKSTHFKPEQFQNHSISSIYSILRRPYKVKDNILIKELAKDTMPKVANLIKNAIEEGVGYLNIFKKVTIE